MVQSGYRAPSSRYFIAESAFSNRGQAGGGSGPGHGPYIAFRQDNGKITDRNHDDLEVVSDPNVTVNVYPTIVVQVQGSLAAVADADVVIRADGTVLKDRYRALQDQTIIVVP